MAVICNNCGSSLVFDPKLQKLLCRSCGGTAEYSESSDTDLYEQDMYTCSTCGAELLCNDTDITMFCQHCGNTHLVFSRIVKSKRPGKILPFKLSKEEAVENVRKHLKSYAFAKKGLKNITFECVRGIYIPYYMLDFDYHCSYFFVYETKDSEGNSRSVEFNRAVNARFDRFMLEASEQLNDYLAMDLNPFDVSGLKDFDPGYLQGFYSDIADDDPEKLYKRTKQVARELTVREARKTGVHAKADIVDSDYRFKFHGTPKYCLFPVWFLTTRFDGKPLTLMVNGQTGKVAGGVPFEKKSLNALRTVIFVILLPLIALLGYGATFIGLSLVYPIILVAVGTGILAGFIQNAANNMRQRINDMVCYSSSTKLFNLTERERRNKNAH